MRAAGPSRRRRYRTRRSRRQGRTRSRIGRISTSSARIPTSGSRATPRIRPRRPPTRPRTRPARTAARATEAIRGPPTAPAGGAGPGLRYDQRVIELRSRDEVDAMRPAGRFVAQVIAALEVAVRPGVSLLDLD